MNKIKFIIATLGLLLIGCSEDDPASSRTVESVSGTYIMTSLIIHEGGDCSADDRYRDPILSGEKRISLDQWNDCWSDKSLL